jgi:hypothetical protein
MKFLLMDNQIHICEHLTLYKAATYTVVIKKTQHLCSSACSSVCHYVPVYLFLCARDGESIVYAETIIPFTELKG